MKEDIKSWYLKTYPDDEYGEEIVERITFKDLLDFLTSTEYYNEDYDLDFYEYIFGDRMSGDSVIRERIFEQLAKLYNVIYDDVYNAWLKVIPNGLFNAKRKLRTQEKLLKKQQERLDEKYNGNTIGLGNAYSSKRSIYNSLEKTNDANSLVLQESIRSELDENHLGGIIVLSTEVNAVKLSKNKLINFLKQKYLNATNSISKDRKIKDVLVKNLSEVGWTVGNFLRGRYVDDNKNVFDEKSFCVEINGITNNKLINVAEELCREFNQDTVLVKLYNPPRILFVDSTPSKEDEIK